MEYTCNAGYEKRVRRAAILSLLGLMLIALGAPALQAQPDDAVVVPALQGTWYLVERGNVIGSTSGPEPVFAFVIQEDGTLAWASIDFRTGDLRPGGVTPQWYRRKIVYTDADSIAFMEQSPDRGMKDRLVAGIWKMDGDVVSLHLNRGGIGFTDVLRRGKLGDHVCDPVKIEATLDINGNTVSPFQTGCVPPGIVYYMKVEEEKVSLHISCPFDESSVCTVRPRIPSYQGPGRYEVDTEAEHLSSISVSDGESLAGKYVNAATSGWIEITALDPDARRCRGSMDIVFDNTFHKWRKGPSLRVKGDFDLPVVVQNELDISTHVISTVKK